MNKPEFITLEDFVESYVENEHNPIEKGIKKYVAGGHIEEEKFYIEKYGNVIEDKQVIGSAFHRLFKKGDYLIQNKIS